VWRPRRVEDSAGSACGESTPKARSSRRAFLKRGLVAAVAVGSASSLGRAQQRQRVTAGHGVSTFVYGQHLVAAAKGFFEAEGLATPDFVVPGDGARVVQALAAGQIQFAIGDASHPLKILEKGRPARMIFATDTRCSYANVVVRSDLFEKGVRSVEALADLRLVGRKAVIAATGIGAGTYVYGVYVLSNTKAADGTPVNHHVEWMAGGASTTILGGLKAGKFDAIMAVPEWQSAAVEGGFGRPIFDVADQAAWNRVFGGPIPVTVGYVLARTIEDSPDLVQSYVDACYRAQQWIRTVGEEEIVDLLWKRFMSTFEREVVLASVRYYRTILDWDFLIHDDDYARGTHVWVPLAVQRPIPFADAVDMSFVRNAQARFEP
jgi:NitT/TauT family transport system substrate-binding protein